MIKPEPVAWRIKAVWENDHHWKVVDKFPEYKSTTGDYDIEPLFTAAQMRQLEVDIAENDALIDELRGQVKQVRIEALEEARAMLKKESHPIAALKIQVLMYSE